MEKNAFLAGAGQIDTTPPLGTRINGDFIAHYATYIHDKLNAKTLVLKDSNKTIILVVVDICIMSQAFIDHVKSLITTQTKIPIDNILISSTHTHAAGAVEEIHMGGADLAYRKRLPNLIVQSVQNAIKNLRPAKVAHGATDVSEHVLCRRYYMTDDYSPQNPVSGKVDQIKTNPIGKDKFIDRPASRVDPQLSYLAVKGLDNNWICVFGNYSMHYVGDWDNGTISSDYFGTFSKCLAKELGASEDFVGIMSNGTSGDANILDFQQKKNYPQDNFEKSRLIGADLANKVSVSIKNNTRWEKYSAIDIKNENISLTRRKPTPEELDQAKTVVTQSDYETMGYTEENLHNNDEDLQKSYAREQVLLNEFPNTTSCPLQVIKIGELLVSCLPGEFFAETGLWIKSHAPSTHSFSIGLANGSIGYVPPANQLKLGGYETWRCRSSCMETGAEQKIRESIITMSNEIE